MKLNPLEHLGWRDAALLGEQKNHQLTNLDHLPDVQHTLDKPK